MHGVQPNVFDEMDWDEAEDLVERMERLRLERDRITFSFLAKLFETTTYILGTGLGLKMKEPEKMVGDAGETGDPDRNARGELEMLRQRKPGEVRPWERSVGEVMDRG